MATNAMTETQITDRPGGHILTNIGVWSRDSQWLVYDTRSDAAGETFDGLTIEIVHVVTREVRELYRAGRGSHCGVATFSPTQDRVVFITGPEHPSADWQYSPFHRQGTLVDLNRPGESWSMDARDITPPFTPGALRGGSHVHVFSGDGQWVSYTYEDHVLAQLGVSSDPAHDINQRNVAVSVPVGPVQVSADHLRNHDGSMFSVVVTQTVNHPRAGSDEISRAFEEAWVGRDGYVRADGKRQYRALAFQGEVTTSAGQLIHEAFLVDLPQDVTLAGTGPLQGTETKRPAPPLGARQKRLTHTADRKFPGLQGPRHWLRSSPDGSRIALFMRDDQGVVQLWTVSPNGGDVVQVTRHPFGIDSTFSWSPDGSEMAYIADGSVFVTDMGTQISRRLTARSEAACPPRPEACVFSPDGRHVAYVRPVTRDGATWNQIFIVAAKGAA